MTACSLDGAEMMSQVDGVSSKNIQDIISFLLKRSNSDMVLVLVLVLV